MESAELRVKMRKDLTLDYWHQAVNKLLSDHDIPILHDRGRHSHREMLKLMDTAYAAFDARRKQEEAKQADQDDLAELESEISTIQSRKKN